nr:hypothetical protein TetV2_00506 [Oceanusvirus sp.]
MEEEKVLHRFTFWPAGHPMKKTDALYAASLEAVTSIPDSTSFGGGREFRENTDAELELAEFQMVIETPRDADITTVLDFVGKMAVAVHTGNIKPDDRKKAIETVRKAIEENDGWKRKNTDPTELIGKDKIETYEGFEISDKEGGDPFAKQFPFSATQLISDAYAYKVSFEKVETDTKTDTEYEEWRNGVSGDLLTVCMSLATKDPDANAALWAAMYNHLYAVTRDDVLVTKEEVLLGIMANQHYSMSVMTTETDAATTDAAIGVGNVGILKQKRKQSPLIETEEEEESKQQRLRVHGGIGFGSTIQSLGKMVGNVATFCYNASYATAKSVKDSVVPSAESGNINLGNEHLQKLVMKYQRHLTTGGATFSDTTKLNDIIAFCQGVSLSGTPGTTPTQRWLVTAFASICVATLWGARLASLYGLTESMEVLTSVPMVMSAIKNTKMASEQIASIVGYFNSNPGTPPGAQQDATAMLDSLRQTFGDVTTGQNTRTTLGVTHLMRAMYSLSRLTTDEFNSAESITNLKVIFQGIVSSLNASNSRQGMFKTLVDDFTLTGVTSVYNSLKETDAALLAEASVIELGATVGGSGIQVSELSFLENIVKSHTDDMGVLSPVYNSFKSYKNLVVLMGYSLYDMDFTWAKYALNPMTVMWIIVMTTSYTDITSTVFGMISGKFTKTGMEQQDVEVVSRGNLMSLANRAQFAHHYTVRTIEKIFETEEYSTFSGNRPDPFGALDGTVNKSEFNADRDSEEISTTIDSFFIDKENYWPDDVDEERRKIETSALKECGFSDRHAKRVNRETARWSMILEMISLSTVDPFLRSCDVAKRFDKELQQNQRIGNSYNSDAFNSIANMNADAFIGSDDLLVLEEKYLQTHRNKQKISGTGVGRRFLRRFFGGGLISSLTGMASAPERKKRFFEWYLGGENGKRYSGCVDEEKKEEDERDPLVNILGGRKNGHTMTGVLFGLAVCVVSAFAGR